MGESNIGFLRSIISDRMSFAARRLLPRTLPGVRPMLRSTTKLKPQRFQKRTHLTVWPQDYQHHNEIVSICKLIFAIGSPLGIVCGLYIYWGVLNGTPERPKYIGLDWKDPDTWMDQSNDKWAEVQAAKEDH